MKFILHLSVLAVLLCLALAQPVADELQELQASDQSIIDSEGPTDVEQAVAQFLRQEAEKDETVVQSHSRQKRAACRCYRRSLNVIVCYCR